MHYHAVRPRLRGQPSFALRANHWLDWWQTQWMLPTSLPLTASSHGRSRKPDSGYVHMPVSGNIHTPVSGNIRMPVSGNIHSPFGWLIEPPADRVLARRPRCDVRVLARRPRCDVRVLAQRPLCDGNLCPNFEVQAHCAEHNSAMHVVVAFTAMHVCCGVYSNRPEHPNAMIDIDCRWALIFFPSPYLDMLGTAHFDGTAHSDGTVHSEISGYVSPP
jgi:hypothetical protein